MRWLLRPPVILGWFESLVYGLGSTGRDPEKLRAERLGYWDLSVDSRAPKAQLYGFMTGLIIWIAATFVLIFPLLGWLVLKGVPVPGFAFVLLGILPIAMLIYVGVLLSLAPIRSTSRAWVVAMSWPVELVVVLLVGLVSWLLTAGPT
ncbi:hypothetical protein ACIGB8_09215 [Promicromonospora sukumoe]|uniref:hypothetical protein n=1 Tax=Promicromonospora sukumoe TaxID=88382 RepID=UPI0037CA9BF9